MVSNMVVGTSIILLGWCIPLGLVMGYNNLPLSAAISQVLLSFADMGLLVDRLYLPFANHLLRTTGSLSLFSIRVLAANFNQRHFLYLFGLTLQLFDFLGIAGSLSLSSARELVANLS